MTSAVAEENRADGGSAPYPAVVRRKVDAVRHALARARRTTVEPFVGADGLPTMLAREELALLYLLARDVVETDAGVVELGTFLGGSTVALGRGLQAAGSPARIATFDRFRQPAWPAYDITEGADVLGRWEQTVAPVRDRVDLHAGELEDCVPADGPTRSELLFVDIVKHPSTMQTVMASFVSGLEPGAIVVHQDLLHWGSPWVGVTIEAMWDRLVYVGQIARSTGVFVVKEPLADVCQGIDWSAVSTPTSMVLLDALARRFTHPTLHGAIALAGLWLARTTDDGLFERRRAAVEPLLHGTRLQRWYTEVCASSADGALRPGGHRR